MNPGERRDTNTLRGRVALVTGASSGIGAATARLLAQQGATAVLAARREEPLRALAQEIEGRGGRALAVPTDVSDRAAIDALVAQAIAAFGRIDILVNDAGIGHGHSIMTEDAHMQRMLAVNLLAPARLMQAVLPHMRRQGGGSIINIGSIAGEMGTSGMYSATKFGLRGLTDSVRREVRRDGIAVTLIEPGYIRTPLTAGQPGHLPGPEVVARALAAAIARPRRTVVVPWYWRIPIILMQLYPSGADRYLLRQPTALSGPNSPPAGAALPQD
jgi:NAD(P)-dependent dehydrogenase (short-subunit alcohol dehydrogenase family)